MMLRTNIEKKAMYLRDMILSANDGIITTFAIISGSEGAKFSSRVIIVLGLAKLFADAISMATSLYLGTKSEVEYEKSRGDVHWKQDSPPLKQGGVALISFVMASFIPLLPFLLDLRYKFIASSVILVIMLLLIGGFQAIQSKRNWIRGGIEMLFVGGGAALIAYLVGFIANKYIV